MVTTVTAALDFPRNALCNHFGQALHLSPAQSSQWVLPLTVACSVTPVVR